LNSIATKVDVHIGENPSTRLVPRIEKALDKEDPDFPHQAQRNEPKADGRCSKPNTQKTYDSTSQAIDKRQQAAQYQRQE